MNIVCCSDNNYLKHTLVMLVSLIENNPGESIDIHLIGTELSEAGKQKAYDTINSYHQTIHFYEFNIHELDDMPRGNHDYISKATWCRLFIQDILPASIEKVLYLDSDIVIVGNLQDLWNTYIEGKYLAAASDEVNRCPEYYGRFGFPMDYNYFNAGVLLINLKEWRKADVKSQMLNFISNPHPILDNADQDVLNVICHSNIVELKLRYNLQDAIVRRKVVHIRPIVEQTIDTEISNARIIHFSCYKKPWTNRCIHPMRKAYSYYLSKTAWKDEKTKLTIKDALYMSAYWCAYWLGLTDKYRKSVSELAKQKNYK